MRVVTALAMLALAVLVVGFDAAAQTRATVSGSVVDPSNSVVPDVTVRLTEAQSGASYQVPASQSEAVFS